MSRCAGFIGFGLVRVGHRLGVAIACEIGQAIEGLAVLPALGVSGERFLDDFLSRSDAAGLARDPDFQLVFELTGELVEMRVERAPGTKRGALCAGALERSAQSIAELFGFVERGAGAQEVGTRQVFFGGAQSKKPSQGEAEGALHCARLARRAATVSGKLEDSSRAWVKNASWSGRRAMAASSSGFAPGR